MFGQPYVSRVVVGGTRDQFDQTVGRAISVDIGNFDLEEEAVVLLDLLSDRNDVGVNSVSINSVAVDSSASRVDLVASGIGVLISHEASHFFGAHHTDRQNEVVLNN